MLCEKENVELERLVDSLYTHTGPVQLLNELGIVCTAFGDKCERSVLLCGVCVCVCVSVCVCVCVCECTVCVHWL